MRFPTGNTGTKEEFERDWYDAQPFGAVTSYGRHEGADINLKTGGDSDLGKELKAIASGTIVYYHRNSHPTSGFGRHIVLKIDGVWGTRWVMYSHMSDQDFLGAVQSVSEGQIIGRLGNSGTPVAHLHFSIFKVDPVGLYNKIDSIAHNETELNQYWEDPIKFINQYLTPVISTDVRLTLLDHANILDEPTTRIAIDRYNYWDQVVQDKANLQTEFNDLKSKYDSLKSRIKTAVDSVIDSTV
jgi:murein DD-endopeptidase MepM/ murein hydrolase activator NlpD